jgi:hypothetical protein
LIFRGAQLTAKPGDHLIGLAGFATSGPMVTPLMVGFASGRVTPAHGGPTFLN